MKKLIVLITTILCIAAPLFASPDAVTNLSALITQNRGEIKLTWTFPGPGSIVTGKYEIQKSTFSETVWGTSTAGNITISTTSVNPADFQTITLTNLIVNSTYYFRLWTSSGITDNYSPLSNGTTIFVIDTSTSWIQITPITDTEDLLRGSSYLSRAVSRSIYQGDGLITENFQPFDMLGLIMAMSPPQSSISEKLEQIRIDKYGNMPSTDVVEMALYYDSTGNYYFDPELVYQGTPTDTKLAVAQYNPTDDAWYFNNLSALSNTTITNLPKTYFISIRLSTTATSDTYFGIKIPSYQSIISSGSTPVKNQNFEIASTTWNVQRTPGKVYVQLNDIAAWYPDNLVYSSHTYAYIGTENIGMLKISLSSLYFNSRIDSINIGRTGTGDDSDLVGMKIFMDGRDDNADGIIDVSSNTNGVFNPSEDMEITNWIPFTDRSANGSFSVSPVIDGISSRDFYIAYKFQNTAVLGKTHGAKVNSITLSEGTVQSYASIESTKVYVVSSTTTVSATISDSVYYVHFGSGTFQAEPSIDMMRLKLRTDQSNAIWEAIQIERTGTGGPQDQTKPEGRNSDVKYIKIFIDTNLSGTLGADDQCISEAQTTFSSAVINNQLSNELPTDTVPPFDLVVESTITSIGTFPGSGSQLLVKVGDELMRYSLAGTTVTALGSKPFLRIVERAKYGTVKKLISSGAIIKKVDMFDLSNDLSKTKLIYLTNQQGLNPSDQTYFIAYDIGDNAVAGNAVGLKISDRNWIKVDAPNEISQNLILETGAGAQIGNPTTFDYCKTTLLPINALNLIVTSQDLAPVSSIQSTANVPLLSLSLRSDKNHITLNQLTIKQTGTVDTTVVPGKGQGDFSAISIWKEATSAGQPYGDGVFNASTDIFISSTAHSTGSAPNSNFVSANAVLPVGDIYISTSAIKLYVVGTIGLLDLANQSTENDLAGMQLETFNGLVIIPQTSVSDTSNTFPYKSTSLKILNQNAIIPQPYAPIPKIWADYGDGYPVMDESVPPDGYVERILDANGNIFVDFNGDGINDLNDLEDLNGDGINNEIDLDGDGLFDYDLDADGIIDLDLNYDGIKDTIKTDANGDGIPDIDFNSDNVIDSYTPQRWTNSCAKLYSKWYPTAGAVKYLISIGKGPDETETSVSNGWMTTEDIKYTISGVSLEELKATKLSADILETYEASPLEPLQIKVESIASFNTGSGGYIYVSSGNNIEIMHYASAGSGGAGAGLYYMFNIDQRACFGTNKLTHLSGTVVSNYLYYYRIKAKTSAGITGPAVLSAIYRVDTAAPSTPSNIQTDTIFNSSGLYTVKVLWDKSTDNSSGVRLYEIQESNNTDPVWKTIATLPNTSLSLTLSRVKNKSFYYRIRSQDCAGNWSNWSTVVRVNTGRPAEIIAEISAYPNPADVKSGQSSKIVYMLNQDAKTKVTIYDLIGDKVYEYTTAPGEVWSGTGDLNLDGKGRGGASGTNIVLWNGRNGAGSFVDSGVYICLIEVESILGIIKSKISIGIK